MMDVLTDITQITMHDEVRRQHVRDLTRRRATLPPQPQSRARDRRAHEPQQRELTRAAPGVTHPRALRPARPFVDDASQARIFTTLRHRKISPLHLRRAHRPERRPCAYPCALDRREAGAITRVAKRHGQHHIGDRAQRHHHAHDRPAMPEQQHRANQHDQRRQQARATTRR